MARRVAYRKLMAASSARVGGARRRATTTPTPAAPARAPHPHWTREGSGDIGFSMVDDGGADSTSVLGPTQSYDPAMADHRDLLIGGVPRPAVEGETFEVHDPHDGSVIAS